VTAALSELATFLTHAQENFIAVVVDPAEGDESAAFLFQPGTAGPFRVQEVDLEKKAWKIVPRSERQ
jgi:hypothetical protein